MGKRRDAKLAALIGASVSAELEKNALMSSATQTQQVMFTPGLSTQAPTLAQSLARNADVFGSQMGPNYPLFPIAIDPLNSNGRADPRKFQYDISENLQITKHLAKWNVLKAAAEQCDVVARAVTIRAAEVAKMDKSWVVSDEAVAFYRDRDNCGTAEASETARKENEKLLSYLNEFWDNPYPQSDKGWRQWIVEAIWQIMVYDGLAIHPAMTLGRKVIGFDIIDASTIKIYLNNQGDTPRPPDPAYAQILFGFPRGEFLATEDKNTPTFLGGEFNITDRDQLSYFVMNPRSWTPYGFSPVEQAIPLVNLYMEYTKMMLFEFKHGTSSDVYIETTGNEMGIKEYAAWDRIFNDYMEGDSANRKKTRTLPDGFKAVFAPTIEERFKPDYVESILKRLAGIFGISSQQLGVIPRAGMGGGKGAQEGDQDNSETVSTKPMQNFIEEFVNSLSRRYLGATKMVTFRLTDDKGGQDDVMLANAAKINTASGVMTLNEQRRELGLDDYDFEGADEPFVVAGNQVVYIRGQFGTQQAVSTQTAIGAASDAQASPQGAQGQEDSGEEGGSQSGAAQAPLGDKATEAKAFKEFSKKPRSREFIFKFHTPEEAQVLKAQIIDTPKGSITKSANDRPAYDKLKAAAKKHATAIGESIIAGMTGIPEAITQALNTSAVGGFKAIATHAVSQNVTFNLSASMSALGDLYDSAHGIVQSTAGDIFNGGQATKSIQQLLSQREIVLNGISDSSMKRISDAIANGISTGASHSEISTAVNAIIADPKRAEVIAQTEMNRAFNQTFSDQMQAAGYSQWEWLADTGACPECAEMAGLHDFGTEQPPLHPNCNCQVVVPDGAAAP